MFKTIFTFFLIFGFFFISIASWCALNKDKKLIVKNVFYYALGCATITGATLALFVYLF